ncbi:hypothetical protein ACFYRG_48185 [Streptomyces mirabilis]|uniref:hypothetical protein n=1 Tax=Streptomyces mirabilis TaxID=68239 RepID=UPI0036BBF312
MTLRTFTSTHQPQSSGVTNNYGDSIVVNGPVSGSAFATGGNNTQTVTHGVDADALTSLVAQLRQVASTFELSGDDAQDLEEEIDLLEQVGADPAGAQGSGGQSSASWPPPLPLVSRQAPNWLYRQPSRPVQHYSADPP